MIFCPYCNAPVNPEGSPTPGQMLVCPRCDESFRYRAEKAENQGDLPAPVTASQPPVAASPPVARPWSNGAIAAVVLGAMATMIVLAVNFTILTEHVRREHDLVREPRRDRTIPVVVLAAALVYLGFLLAYLCKVWQRKDRPEDAHVRIGTGILIVALALVAIYDLGSIATKLGFFKVPVVPTTQAEPSPPISPPASTAPETADELSALGWVPKHTTHVLSIRVGDAMKTTAGKAFLKKLPTVGGALLPLDFEKWSGLALDDIEHAALALASDGKSPMQVVLAIQTRKPYDAKKIMAGLKTSKPVLAGDRQTHPFKLEKSLFGGNIWFAPGDRVLFVGLSAKSIEAVAFPPDQGSDRLSVSIQKLKDRLDMKAMVFLASHFDQEAEIRALLGFMEGLEALPKLEKDQQDVVARLRTVGGTLQFTKGLELSAVMECADEKSAGELAKHWLPDPAKPVEPSKDLPPLFRQLAPLLRELATTLKWQQQGSLLTMTAAVKEETVLKALDGK